MEKKLKSCYKNLRHPVYKREIVIPAASVEQFPSFGESLVVRDLWESENQDRTNSSKNVVTPDINNSQSFIELDTNQRKVLLTLLIDTRIKRPKIDKASITPQSNNYFLFLTNCVKDTLKWKNPRK